MKTQAKRATSWKVLPHLADRLQPPPHLVERVAENLELFHGSEPHPSTLVPQEPVYSTNHGAMYIGNALDLLAKLPDHSQDLVRTSPPYALHFKKEYGNVDKEAYVEWFRPS